MTPIEINFENTELMIAHALELVKELHGQIVQEADALLDKSGAELIGKIAGNKQDLVGQLEQFQGQLSQLLANENLASSDEGVQNFFQKAKNAGLAIENAHKQWSEIKLLSIKCRTLNDQNGMTINLLTLHTNRALQILKGQPTTCTTYGRDGSGQRENFTHTLLSA